MSMQSQSHRLCLKQQTKNMRLHCISEYSMGNEIIVSIVGILPEESRRMHVRKQSVPQIMQYIMPGAWGHRRNELPWADANLPFK